MPFSYPACTPGCWASVDRAELWTGNPRWWPISTEATPMSVFSGLPRDMLPVRISRIPGPQQARTAAPGATAWTAVTRPRISAHIRVSMPATVMGPVAPAMAIE